VQEKLCNYLDKPTVKQLVIVCKDISKLVTPYISLNFPFQYVKDNEKNREDKEIRKGEQKG
jgi:hypothetical protein